ncbi:MAG: peptidase U32 family protein, partial [Leptonema sp. (in: bacteria)]
MSSKDLCMIEHLPLLVEAGVNSFKIEGRMKGINYLAGVVKTYREAIDSIEKQNFILQEKWLKELNMFSNRGYTTGMYFGPHPDDGYQHHGRSRNTLELGLAGVVQQVDDDGVWLLARDKIYINDSIVFLRNGLEEEIFTIKEIRTSNKSMELLKNAEIAKLILDKPIPNVQPLDIARKIKEPILQK